jgi:hypothetical protein
MAELSPETEALLRRARQETGETMPAFQRRRLKSAVLARVALAGTSAVAAPAAASLLGVGAKVVVGVVVVATMSAGGYVALRGRHHAPPPRPIAAAPAPLVVAEAPPEPPRAPPARHAPVRHVATRAHVSVEAAPTPAPDPIRAETALLRDADHALRTGNPRGALALLARHRARFPGGALAPERDAAELIARCQLGERGAADAARASRLSAPLAARVRAACAAPATPSE